ncbi:2-phospho-L-lactate guanylyltransferase [Saccharopolyspora subtropica]|uniref:Phosphoenolpyruvate guanylyltransferase n=1 Tax=Saccharopolyspora thermophila TaxID=89367 RepID=A0A917JJU5_9PSEU|nr:2-phospho-L-lactate guanylyltransferase [Saccharopolyspora subtropica]GGI73326.1 2-phospho-L-lactate guanylyltransferase [Saccharopolyspora subtropica]
MTAGVNLIVPIKPLHAAKSRLLGAADRGAGRPDAHAGLVTAVALDTVLAAREAPGVDAVVVVTADPALTEAFTAEGVEVLADTPAAGLNAALRHADALLRRRGVRVGALQADLPALRPGELGAAVSAAGPSRAFCADRHGTGTTLLLAEPGRPLDPRFGPGSAAAHTASGARPLPGRWDSLRCDVDTEADLAAATRLGLGPRTAERIAATAPRCGG